MTMTKRRALNEAVRRWGKGGAVTFDARQQWEGYKLPTSNEERAAYLAAFRELKAKEPKVAPLSEWPVDTLLGEYRAALEAHRLWKKELSAVQGLQWFYRCSVGTTEHGFYSSYGRGDTFEEAFADADAKTAKRSSAVAEEVL